MFLTHSTLDAFFGTSVYMKGKITSQLMDLVRSKKTQLPPLPVIIENILRFAGTDPTSAKDLAEDIRKGQSIANMMLTLANAAYYGLVGKVDTILRTITVGGFNEGIGLPSGMSVFFSLR